MEKNEAGKEDFWDEVLSEDELLNERKPDEKEI